MQRPLQQAHCLVLFVFLLSNSLESFGAEFVATEAAHYGCRLNALRAFRANLLSVSPAIFIYNGQASFGLDHEHVDENDNTNENKAKQKSDDECPASPFTRSPALGFRKVPNRRHLYAVGLKTRHSGGLSSPIRFDDCLRWFIAPLISATFPSVDVDPNERYDEEQDYPA
jgi:hypothetical protein